MEKTYDASTIKVLEIDGEGMFHISVVSTDTSLIKVAATIEGETFENIVLQVQHDQEKMTIAQGYAPFFIPKNDKLAAHKVIAIELQIIVPENMIVHCKTASAAFYGKGSFNELKVATLSGNCALDTFGGKGSVTTHSGNITATIAPTIIAQAISRQGSIFQETTAAPNPSLILQTNTGDIRILETE